MSILVLVSRSPSCRDPPHLVRSRSIWVFLRGVAVRGHGADEGRRDPIERVVRDGAGWGTSRTFPWLTGLRSRRIKRWTTPCSRRCLRSTAERR